MQGSNAIVDVFRLQSACIDNVARSIDYNGI